MLGNLSLPEHCKVVAATAGSVTTNGGVTFDHVMLRDVNRAWIVAMFLQAASHATTIQPVVGATDGGCTTSITFSARWWKNADISTTDTLTAQTAGTSMACDAGTTNQILVIEIDPADVAAQSSTYDWLGGTIATSGESTDYVTAFYVLDMRYKQAATPAVIA
mgnify:CR=1 FL=1